MTHKISCEINKSCRSYFLSGCWSTFWVLWFWFIGFRLVFLFIFVPDLAYGRSVWGESSLIKSFLLDCNWWPLGDCITSLTPYFRCLRCGRFIVIVYDHDRLSSWGNFVRGDGFFMFVETVHFFSYRNLPCSLLISYW